MKHQRLKFPLIVKSVHETRAIEVSIESNKYETLRMKFPWGLANDCDINKNSHTCEEGGAHLRISVWHS